MPESDVTKMKVADLKRELKLRGLSVTGNKIELQDRLQTALLDGELALDDSAMTGDDLLDEDDGVLTDEEEAKILVGDENDLLKSPINITPEVVPDTEKTTTDDDLLSTPPTAAKKIILKRQTSATKNISFSNTSKENTEPTPPKTLKMSERNPITIGDKKADTQTASSEATNATKKVAELTAQERMDLRAKKFGINKSVAAGSQIPQALNKKESVPIVADKNIVPDEKQIEILKKRAERFGCVVSSKMVKLDAEERLEKRKQRFGGEAVGSSNAVNSTATDDWSEKARKRLERFGDTSTATAVNSTIASNGIASTGNE